MFSMLISRVWQDASSSQAWILRQMPGVPTPEESHGPDSRKLKSLEPH